MGGTDSGVAFQDILLRFVLPKHVPMAHHKA